jgi:uncharacterized membrane protein
MSSDPSTPTPGDEAPETKPAKKRISLRRAFFTGAVALLPTALTLVILVWVGLFVHNYIAEPVNWVIIEIMKVAGVDNASEVFCNTTDTETGIRHGILNFSFAGYVVAFCGIFFVGLILLTFFGRRLYRLFDRIVSRMPVVRMVYPHIKQLTEFIFSDSAKSSFRRVVMVEYPRRGLWSVGFITGSAMAVVQKMTEKHVVSVFIPSSPTPFTGYIVAVPEDEVINLPISVDEALRFTVSGGVLVPPGQRQAIEDDSVPESAN